MAKEITVNAKLVATKGNLSQSRSETCQPNMAGTHYAARGMDIPTTAAGTALDLGSVATAGYALLKNLDATNYVEVGVQVAGTFYPLVRLLAGESAVFRFAISSGIYARANTATVVLDYLILEA
jgi:hypothetical protein